MKPITIKVVFDRKNEADTKKKKGLVQVRITCERRQMFISTGIKVFKNQWDAGKERVKNSMQSASYNSVIDTYIDKINIYRNECAKDNAPFDFERLKAILLSDSTETFLSFMERRIRERGDIRESTRKAHLSCCSVLKDSGKSSILGI